MNADHKPQLKHQAESPRKSFLQLVLSSAVLAFWIVLLNALLMVKAPVPLSMTMSSPRNRPRCCVKHRWAVGPPCRLCPLSRRPTAACVPHGGRDRLDPHACGRARSGTGEQQRDGWTAVGSRYRHRCQPAIGLPGRQRGAAFEMEFHSWLEHPTSHAMAWSSCPPAAPITVGTSLDMESRVCSFSLSMARCRRRQPHCPSSAQFVPAGGFTTYSRCKTGAFV